LNVKSGEQVIGLKKLLRSFFVTNKFLCCMMMVLFLLIAFMSMFRPIVVGYMFHHGYQMKNIHQLVDYVSLLLMMNGFIIILSAIRAVIYTRFEIKILSQLQTVVMKKIVQLPVYFFDHYTTGDLVHRVLWIASLSQLFSSNQIGLFFSFFSLFTSFSIMFYFNWQLTIAVFILIVFFTFFAVLSSRRLLPCLLEHAKDMGQAYGFLLQVINGISRIKLFARQSYVESLWVSMYVRSRNQLQNIYCQGVLGYAFFNSIPLFLLIIIFSMTVMQQHSLFSQHFVVFFCGLSLLMTSIVSFYINAGGFIDALIAYWHVQPILSAPIEQAYGLRNQRLANDSIEHIHMNDLYFAYPDSKISILHGLNCQISCGQHVAFVGLSGSGKSTLLKLLLGFYLPQQGHIEINSKRLQDIDLLRFRSSIGVVLQDGQLMNGTILENIIGHSAATEEDAWNILSELELCQFVATLPMGIHTVVSQYLNLLSGGQKQMLLIARSLVANPQLLILDEATNSLDNPVQEMVTNRINQLGMTRITIAHRLSTVKHVDKIFVLHQGTISQAGTYQQLINQKGLFYQLARSQDV
jgi:ABC-type bacteriocin/lantibiotic exporter with double-glycine peptidase domain